MNRPFSPWFISPQTVAFIEMIMVSPAATSCRREAAVLAGHGPSRRRLCRQLPDRPQRAADGRGLGPLPRAVRRIREDLIHLGLVDRGPAIRIADGAQASAGDLIICRANDHHLEAGEPGRALANGDVLRIEAITGGGIMVRRLLGADPATG
jgi:hypothetical protein